jgi:hypothetical protein
VAAASNRNARRRKALLAALALDRGEVDPSRLARLLSECAQPAPRPVLR